MSLTFKPLRHCSIGTKLFLVVVILQLAGFIGLSIFLSQSSISEVKKEVSSSIEREQSNVANMVSLFDKTLQEEASAFLDLFLTNMSPRFTLNPIEKINVAGRETPLMSNGTQRLNGDFTLPDRFTSQTGAPVTIFARDGEDFVRVTTSLKKANGDRAVGTLLNRSSRSYQKLMADQPYVGIATLFGTPYITKYQPIHDSAGEVIGASFIGIDITNEIAMLKDRVRGMTFDASGYTMIVEAGADNQGQVIAGGPHEGESLSTLKDRQGDAVFSGLFDTDTGKLEYALSGGDERERTTYFLAYPDWNWVIATTVFDDEVEAGILTLRNRALLVAVVMALLVATALYYFQRSLISRPLKVAAGMAERLSNGDLSQRIKTDRTDEVGSLMRAMNGIGEGLTDIVGQVRASTGSVEHAAGEVAQSSEDLSKRTEQAASNLQQTSSSMEEITATVQNTSDSAQEASELVASTNLLAQQGNTAMRDTQSTMNDLNASAGKIGEIITLIDGIAFQTNILALNASVEAARAGEHGRGFAVVAHEVRSLATRSGDAASDIRALINESLEHTKTGAALVEGAATTMTEILQSVERVSGMISDISAGAKEQSDGISQINLAVNELDTMTQQNATMVEQASAASEEMRHQASHLTQLMATFDLGDAAEQPQQKLPARHSNGTSTETPASTSEQRDKRSQDSEAHEWETF